MKSVLDKGFVELVDSMGSDERIVEAARISYSADSVNDKAAFISKIWKAGHTSPFEQVVLTYRIKCPIFCARQIMRHRTARINEVSLRYSRSPCEFYENEELDERARSLVNLSYSRAATVYKELLAMGVKKEQARAVLPLGTYTEFFFQIDLHNLFHFLKLRMASSAQSETRDIAEEMFELAKSVAPLACEAFER